MTLAVREEINLYPCRSFNVAIKTETSVYELRDNEHAAYRLKILLCICKCMETEMTTDDFNGLLHVISQPAVHGFFLCRQHHCMHLLALFRDLTMGSQ